MHASVLLPTAILSLSFSILSQAAMVPRQTSTFNNNNARLSSCQYTPTTSNTGYNITLTLVNSTSDTGPANPHWARDLQTNLAPCNLTSAPQLSSASMSGFNFSGYTLGFAIAKGMVSEDGSQAKDKGLSCVESAVLGSTSQSVDCEE